MSKADNRTLYCMHGGDVEYISYESMQYCTHRDSDDNQNSPSWGSSYNVTDSMVEDLGILVTAWMISLSAVVGNIATIITTIWYMYHKKQMRKGQKLMKWLFLSLSFSDLIVGIFAMVLCFLASTAYRVHYHEYDYAWRSGSACTALGVLFVLGSEQSVFTMLLIAFARYKAIVRPFERPLLSRTQIALVMTWVASTLIAIIPVIPQFEDYFMDTLIMHIENCTSRVVWECDKSEYPKRILRRVGNQSINRTIRSWSALVDTIGKIYPGMETQKFAYYASYAVCIPNIFPKHKSSSLHFSLILLAINSFAFVAMATGYILIIQARKSTESNVENTANVECVSDKLQIRVAIILVTDLFCWIPVCIIAVISFAGARFKEKLIVNIAFILLTINSAINPFIYSGTPSYLWNKLQPVRSSVWRVCRACAARLQSARKGKSRNDMKQKNEVVMITDDRNIAAEQPQVLQTTM